MRPYMYKAYQFSFNIEKYFIFLKTTLIHVKLSINVSDVTIERNDSSVDVI